MNAIICPACGESKPEIAFEINRGGSLRKKCRVCRSEEKRRYSSAHRERKGPSYGSRTYLRGFIDAAW